MAAEGWLAGERDLMLPTSRELWTPPAERAAKLSAPVLTLSEYATRCIAERNLKPRTRQLYESQWKAHIKPTLGHRVLRSITPETVRAWFAALGTKHSRRNSQVYGLLHSILATAVTDGHIDSNPCHIKGVMNAPAKRQPLVLGVAELVDLASRVPERYKAMVLVSAWCGLRFGEAIELRRKDIENDAEVVYIRRGATHRKGCQIDTPKGGKGRAVVVPPHIRADLKHHLDVFCEKDRDALVFAPARGGCHLKNKVFRDAIGPAKCRRSWMRSSSRPISCSAGPMASRVGLLRETMARLGHSTVKASLIYQGLVSDRDAEVAAALSELATK
ncbi:hypothetical protein A5662_06475 [Mycobacteriaceae bacterium 1482268.1]|nr:hypothetical protein A5662_06475 [Mycobacteriaceae bacterium 1482268.1]